MVSLPEPLQSFKLQAKRCVARGLIGEIEFSGSTYQVQVIDPITNEKAWAFLQFDSKNVLRDSFCSCEGVGDVLACVHLAAAYLRIFHNHSHPLHIRFRDSLWNQLCLICSDRYGEDSTILKNKAASYFIGETKNLPSFLAKGRTLLGKDKLQAIFHERRIETEESSLKFSNLSVEEIILWREGRPSLHLKYELSFWNDLAKWLMLMQDEGEKYKIDFEYSEEKLPKRIIIQFLHVELQFSLEQNELQKIIPSLATVSSPLIVHFAEERSIQEITYDEKKGELHIIPHLIFTERQQKLEKEGFLLENWIYVPKKSFYAREQHHLLESPILIGQNIGEALNHHFPIIKKYLKGTSLNDESTALSYSLYFDSEWNLHIESYLYEMGDLKSPFSRYLEDWVYLEKKGFFRIERSYFENPLMLIVPENVPDFVKLHRAWLNSQEGFQIHITGIESKLTYQLTKENTLIFSKKLVDEASVLTKDFGPWIYLKGLGFFSKTDAAAEPLIRPGLSISQAQIPFFIHSNQAELQFVPEFFSPTCPIAQCSLIVELTIEKRVKITPKYEIKPYYRKKNVQIFDDCVYVEGEGFSIISPSILLPEKFRYTQELSNEAFSSFFSHEWENIKKYARSIDSRLACPRSLLLTGSLQVAENGNYTLKLFYQSELGLVSAANLWKHVQKKDRFIFTEAGLIDLAEDRFKWILKIKKNQLDLRSNTWNLSTLDLLRLSLYDQFHAKEGKEIFQSLMEFKISEEPNLTLIKSHLRPYQLQGIKWLWFLYQHQLSGLLCDDMGLGKTHQAMALLAAAVNFLQTKRVEKSHFLVVCPTSVIYHWEEKIEEYLPSMRVCTFHGSRRSLNDFQHDYDILLTSYGIWRNECELLSQVPFEIAIFDEIQAAKNQTSRIHASLLRVKAITRLGLTGTPIENKLRELKALFDLILPGYMPSESEYRDFFINAIEKEGNQEKKEKLSKYIKPFVLRRVKKDVLLDLPEKVEEISHCDLSNEQVVMYTDVLRRMREGLMSKLQDQNQRVPYLHIFSVLSSLKQICNHPAAFFKDPENYKNYQSGKWDLFLELLNEAQDSGQKVVVFSQYLAMLDIIENYLTENQIQFASIRGATTDRGQQVRTFNSDPNCRVFVGSLQAAGLGIDLTAASVVIHYDRWWNAAREAQATDRVHRIGQTRGVQVFKLVTKGTFEERIDDMITRKGKLMEEVIGVDDHNFVKKFDRNELILLLQDLKI
jgi:superfamily II DNA or RNA helicase